MLHNHLLIFSWCLVNLAQELHFTHTAHTHCRNQNPLSASQRLDIVRFLELGWPVADIAIQVRVSPTAVYNTLQNLVRYGAPVKPQFSKVGRPRKLSQADEDRVFEWLLEEGWRDQDEIVKWLHIERGVEVSRTCISRMLKRRRWTRKAAKRQSNRASHELRHLYLEDLAQYRSEDLVFLDESIFNEKTGWRHHAYAPIGQPARYEDNMMRGKTWAICAAMTLQGWLPCTGVREGYFKADDFYNWVVNTLLPAIQGEFDGAIKVIVLDNVNVHTDNRIIHEI
jgi:transposase